MNSRHQVGDDDFTAFDSYLEEIGSKAIELENDHSSSDSSCNEMGMDEGDLNRFEVMK